MNKMQIEKYSLLDLKRKFEANEFAIPEIQRQYVWKKPSICKLMDSIFKNYPIGIGLIWTAKISEAINIRPNNKTIIPPFNKRAQKADLIIDGQQRLSTIYGVLFGIGENNEAQSYINFSDLYFNCDLNTDNRFIFSRRNLADTVGYVRLTTLLNNSPSVLKRRLKLNSKETNEVRKCYNAFHSYNFYLLSFEGVKYENVREIFVRINSAGMTVSRADTLFAKASSVNLREHMLDTKRGLKHGYSSISVDALQTTLALAYGATKVGNIAFSAFLNKIEKNKNRDKEFVKIWKRLQYGYEEAVDFLVNTLKVTRVELLPSQNIFSILAYFFYINKSRARANQIKEIKKWFWHTSCGERYSGGGFNKNIPNDIKFFKRLAVSNQAKYQITEKILPIDFLKTSYKNMGASSTSAYYIMLRSKKPKYLINNHEMLLDDFSSISNRKDRHHIFPSALMRRKSINAKWVNSIANICYLAADENQSISDKHPRLYLNDYKRKRGFGSIMKSHLIPFNSSSPIWSTSLKPAFIDFINIRGKMIISEIEKLSGAKIFDKLDPIKRI